MDSQARQRALPYHHIEFSCCRHRQTQSNPGVTRTAHLARAHCRTSLHSAPSCSCAASTCGSTSRVRRITSTAPETTSIVFPLPNRHARHPLGPAIRRERSFFIGFRSGHTGTIPTFSIIDRTSCFPPPHQSLPRSAGDSCARTFHYLQNFCHRSHRRVAGECHATLHCPAPHSTGPCAPCLPEILKYHAPTRTNRHHLPRSQISDFPVHAFV